MDSTDDVFAIQDPMRFRLVVETRALVNDFIKMMREAGVEPSISLYVGDRPDEPLVRGWASPTADIIFEEGLIHYETHPDKTPITGLMNPDIPLDYLEYLVKGLREEIGTSFG
jgi:hypothetical protein